MIIKKYQEMVLNNKINNFLILTILFLSVNATAQTTLFETKCICGK